MTMTPALQFIDALDKFLGSKIGGKS